jgi:hypothetical protein
MLEKNRSYDLNIGYVHSDDDKTGKKLKAEDSSTTTRS